MMLASLSIIYLFIYLTNFPTQENILNEKYTQVGSRSEILDLFSIFYFEMEIHLMT